MLKTRLYTAGIGLLAAATFALTGCTGTTTGTESDTPPTTAAPQADARQAFTDALTKLGEQSFKADMKLAGIVTLTSTGVADPAAKKADMDMELDAGGTKLTVDMLASGGDVWVKLAGVPGMPDKWMHVPAGKVKAGSTLDATKSPAELAAAVVSIERDGATGFKGTLDLTKASTINQDTVAQLGDKATAVPFTATVDAQGRLTEMTIDMNAIQPGAGKMTTAYSAFGEPVSVTPPAAADVVEMSPEILAMLNR